MQMQTIVRGAQQTAAIVAQSRVAIAFFLTRHGRRFQKCSNIRCLAATCSCIVLLGGGWFYKGKGICSHQRAVMVSRSSWGPCVNDRLADLHVQPRLLGQLTVNRLLCVSLICLCCNKPLGSENTADREACRKRRENCQLQASSGIFIEVFKVFLGVLISW